MHFTQFINTEDGNCKICRNFRILCTAYSQMSKPHNILLSWSHLRLDKKSGIFFLYTRIWLKSYMYSFTTPCGFMSSPPNFPWFCHLKNISRRVESMTLLVTVLVSSSRRPESSLQRRGRKYCGCLPVSQGKQKCEVRIMYGKLRQI